jgi:hypothetical protein
MTWRRQQSGLLLTKLTRGKEGDRRSSEVPHPAQAENCLKLLPDLEKSYLKSYFF